MIQGYATAFTLNMAGDFMIKGLRDLDFETWTELVPAAVTALIMTFSYSIAEGIIRGSSPIRQSGQGPESSRTSA